MVKNNAYVHTDKTCLPPCLGKNITADGRNGEGTCPSCPTAPNRPPGTFRGEEAPQAHHPAGTPGRKQQQRPLPCPPWPLSPGFVVVTAQAAGQILTGTGRESEERAGEAGAAQSRGRSLAAAPLLRSAGRARAPPGGERRRLSGAGREPGAGTSRGRSPSGAGSPQNRRNRGVGGDL